MNFIYIYLIKNNYKIKYYLFCIFIFMISSGIFILTKYCDKLYSNNYIKIFFEEDYEINKNNIDLLYNNRFEKIIKIINNPIKYDYEIEKKNFFIDKDKLNKIKNDLNYIIKNKNSKSYNKYIIIKNILKSKNFKKNITKKILLLLYINF